MKKHTKIYMDHFQFTEACFIPCEICGAQATEIHHIEARGMGGGKGKDHIDNLMAVCRTDHEKYGDKTEFKQWLKDIHTSRIAAREQSVNRWTVYGSGKNPNT